MSPRSNSSQTRSVPTTRRSPTSCGGATALNQSGVLAPLNSIPGLSGVSLGAEGSDDETAATISAYVGSRLYLSYGVGIYEPINALTARLYLRSRLWLEVVSRLENSFDLYYRFDID